MKLEIKNLWIKALKSGEFKQGKGQLEKDGTYCALGVLSILAVLEGICTYNVGGKFDGRQRTLSFNVREWSGIKTGKAEFEDGEFNIADLNDSGLNFAKIADVIESNWSDL